MKIKSISIFGNNELTQPFPKENGVFLALRGGDLCHPLGSGNWFSPPYFTRVWRAFVSLPVIPFLSWKVGSKGGYIGAKVYGVDAEAYKNWLPPEEVYSGSLAFMISIRPFATLQ